MVGTDSVANQGINRIWLDCEFNDRMIWAQWKHEQGDKIHLEHSIITNLMFFCSTTYKIQVPQLLCLAQHHIKKWYPYTQPLTKNWLLG